jgi:hypothetical protein
MYLKNLVATVVLAALVFSSCKKDEKGDTVFFSNGSATGTIKGTKTDNSILDETFTFNKYIPILNNQYYLRTSNNQLKFYIEFSDENNNGLNLEFTLSSTADNTPENIDFWIEFNKTSDNKIFHYDMTDNNNTAVISDFTFDESTGKLKCKLVVTGTNNSTEKNATVTASIDVTLKERVQ